MFADASFPSQARIPYIVSILDKRLTVLVAFNIGQIIVWLNRVIEHIKIKLAKLSKTSSGGQKCVVELR